MPLPPRHKLLYILIFWIAKPLTRLLLKLINAVEWVFKRIPAIPSRIKMFTLFGTEVQVQKFTLLYLLWYPYGGWSEGHTLKAVAYGLLYIVTTFAIITAHEFCHIFVAKSYGIRTPTVLLNPFGGMAEMEMDHFLMPARKEFFITIAGPLFNAVMFLIFVRLWNPPDDFKALHIFSWEGFQFLILALNFVMMIFNFLPIFPMDGGRVLRASLISVFKLSDVKATQIVCWTACILAPCFSIWAMFTGRWIIAMVMPFMAILAIAEYQRVKRLVALHNAEVEKYNSTLANEAQ